MQRSFPSALAILSVSVAATSRQDSGSLGSSRSPSIRGGTIVFTAEGVWTVPVQGGLARRLTSHPGEESHAAISPDGSTIAVSANYGPEGRWLIEAHGVAALNYLEREIRAHPLPVPPAPAYPRKGAP